MAKAKKNDAGTQAAAPELNIELLKQVVAATNAGSYTMTAAADHEALVTAGLVEVNNDPAFADAEGRKATRATAAGIERANAEGGQATAQEQTAAQAAEAKPDAKPSFAIVTGVPIPESRRTGGNVTRTETYPFGKLEVGQSFFIPATEKNPKPEIKFASTVNSARERYATIPDANNTRTNRKGNVVPVKEYTRDFKIRGGVDGTPYGFPGTTGAAVWRVK